MKPTPQRVCEVIGWIVGFALSILTMAQMLTLPCRVLDWPLRPTCGIVEKMNLRPFSVASFR